MIPVRGAHLDVDLGRDHQAAYVGVCPGHDGSVGEDPVLAPVVAAARSVPGQRRGWERQEQRQEKAEDTGLQLRTHDDLQALTDPGFPQSPIVGSQEADSQWAGRGPGGL